MAKRSSWLPAGKAATSASESHVSEVKKEGDPSAGCVFTKLVKSIFEALSVTEEGIAINVYAGKKLPADIV